MERKGQAAMEFLMTYGWAILAAIIAIGVLAYFGVFSAGKYAPNAAVVNPPFYANGATLTASQVEIELKNNGGEDYNVTEVSVSGCTTSDGAVGNVSAGNAVVATVTGCTDATSGQTFKGDITVKYTKAGSALEQISTGTISGKVA